MKRFVRLTLVLAVLMQSARVQAAGVWIEWSTNTDTRGGGMSQPVKVSSAADFDAYMNSLPTNTAIHLLAGTFQTETYFNVKSGWTISGDGIDQTIVQVTNLGPNPTLGVWWQSPMFPVFCSGLSKYIRGARISDLTVDCNLQNQSYAASHDGMNMEAVALRGDDLHVERVKVIHFGSTARAENFTIALSYTGRGWSVTNLTIDGCIITEPAVNATFPGGMTCLQLGGLPYPLAADRHETDTNAITKVGLGWSFGAEIKNCKIYGIHHAGGAMGAVYQAHCKIHDNLVLDCPDITGFYSENTCYDGLEVANNIFSNVSRGVLIDDYGFENVRLRRNFSIHGNTIQDVSSLGVSLVGSLSPKANGFDTVAISENRVGGGPGHPAIRVDDATNVVIVNNILNDPGNGFQVWLGRDARVLETNNHNFDNSAPITRKE